MQSGSHLDSIVAPRRNATTYENGHRSEMPRMYGRQVEPHDAIATANVSIRKQASPPDPARSFRNFPEGPHTTDVPNAQIFATSARRNPEYAG